MYKRYRILAYALFLLAAIGFFHAAHVSADTCNNQYTFATAVATGYGAACNPFSIAKELLVQAQTCSQGSVNVTVGSGNASQYVYKQDYVWNDAERNAVVFTSASVLTDETWYGGSATGNVVSIANSTTYVVDHVYQQIDGVWKCGCWDSACATFYLQLQSITMTASGGTVGTGGSGTTGNGVGIPVILDTDFGGDIDDAGTVAIANELHYRGEVKLLAIVSSSWNGKSVDGIDVINTYYGNGNVPVGRHSLGIGNGETNSYDEHIANNHPHNRQGSTAPSATQVYRQVLAAAQPDNSVVIVVTGYLTNIKSLLESGPDSHSSLNGKALFAQKVKRLHIMGGQYPSSNESASPNFVYSGSGVAKYVVDTVTRPIVFNGDEIGSMWSGYKTGDALRSQPLTNPVARAYHYFFTINPPNWVNNGNPYSAIQEWSIWDQIALIVAVRGSGTYFNEGTNGFNEVAANGHNKWQASPDKDHTFLTKEMDPKQFADSVVQPLMIKSAN